MVDFDFSVFHIIVFISFREATHHWRWWCQLWWRCICEIESRRFSRSALLSISVRWTTPCAEDQERAYRPSQVCELEYTCMFNLFWCVGALSAGKMGMTMWLRLLERTSNHNVLTSHDHGTCTSVLGLFCRMVVWINFPCMIFHSRRILETSESKCKSNMGDSLLILGVMLYFGAVLETNFP
jgi:hypothetical protein